MNLSRIFVVVIALSFSLSLTSAAQLSLPYTGSTTNANPAFKITNLGTGIGIHAISVKGDRAIFGENQMAGGTGVYGIANVGLTSTGVYGVSQNGRGVVGVTYNGEAGMKGANTKKDGIGVYGIADTGAAAMGVYGFSQNGRGVVGVTQNGEAGVKGGSNKIGGTGVLGIADNGSVATGVYGISQHGRGVVGVSHQGEAGVVGANNKVEGLGVKGVANAGYGLYGTSTNGIAVFGTTLKGRAGVFRNPGTDSATYTLLVEGYHKGAGLYSVLHNTYNTQPAVATLTAGTGRSIECRTVGLGTALMVESTNNNNTLTAVKVDHTGKGSGLEVSLTNSNNTRAGIAVWNQGGGYGIQANTASAPAMRAMNDSGSLAYLGTAAQGVWAETTAESSQAIVGKATGADSYAAFLQGKVSITGNLSKSSGSFKIDHPLDPENKYLYHSFVESPDMMNVYNGNVILDDNGEAWVYLPDYFQALNKDFRYQLTCIGGFAPVYIAQKIEYNAFRIAGGTPGLEVSWQVTGVRQDAYANAHRILVEEMKPVNERGYFLHPAEHGAAKSLSVTSVVLGKE